MRLGRGSGVAGLAAMRRIDAARRAASRWSARCSSLTKRDLLVVCAAEGLAFVADPSNEDPAYRRVRLRRHAEERRRAGARSAGPAAAGTPDGASGRGARGRGLRAGWPSCSRSPKRRRWRANLSALRDAAPEIVQRLVGGAVRLRRPSRSTCRWNGWKPSPTRCTRRSGRGARFAARWAARCSPSMAVGLSPSRPSRRGAEVARAPIKAELTRTVAVPLARVGARHTFAAAVHRW